MYHLTSGQNSGLEMSYYNLIYKYQLYITIKTMVNNHWKAVLEYLSKKHTSWAWKGLLKAI